MARPLAGQTQTMSGMDRHSELQQHKTAAEYRQAADEHVRTLKDFWKDFLVSGLFVLAAIVAIFACLAWFAANNRVSATGSTIGAKGPRFVLSGTQGGTAGKYDAQDNYASDSTSLAVNNLFNLNNMSADGSLSPGSAGQLQLNVKPLCNDLHDITVEMTWEISVQTSVAGTDGTATDASKNEEIINSLKNLVRGHILVFQGKDTSGFYSNPLVPTTTTVTQDGASVTVITQSFTIPAKSFRAEGSNNTTETVTKTLYWIWPEQFKSYVRTGNAGYGGNLFANTGDEGDTRPSSATSTITTRAISAPIARACQVRRLARFRLSEPACPLRMWKPAPIITTTPTRLSARTSSTFACALPPRRRINKWTSSLMPASRAISNTTKERQTPAATGSARTAKRVRLAASSVSRLG